VIKVHTPFCFFIWIPGIAGNEIIDFASHFFSALSGFFKQQKNRGAVETRVHGFGSSSALTQRSGADLLTKDAKQPEMTCNLIRIVFAPFCVGLR